MDLCYRSEVVCGLVDCLDELVEEGLSECWGIGAFGVPLNSKAELGVWVVDRFDDVVVSGREGLVASWIGDDLFVVGHDGPGLENGFVEGVDGVGVVPVVGVVLVSIGEVLVHGSPTAEREHLHSEADAEDGDIWVGVELVDKLGFEGLAFWEDWGDRLMGRDSERFGSGIVSS